MISGFDSKIEDKLNEIEQIQAHLDSATSELDQANARRDTLKVKLSAGKETLSQRVCAI